ncbi:MAG: hypothetical protein IJ272_07500 [Clostridia bacterium]|nr:hypothetical protein [Clostridia bacterium]
MKKVVIVASSKLHNEIKNWITHFKNKGYTVLNYPKQIDEEKFIDIYPDVYKSFFEDIVQTDMLFVMNEDKNGVEGYIGAEAFAELSFGLVQKLVYGKDIEVVLLKMPSCEVQCYDEIKLWLDLGKIKLHSDKKDNDFIKVD